MTAQMRALSNMGLLTKSSIALQSNPPGNQRVDMRVEVRPG